MKINTLHKLVSNEPIIEITYKYLGVKRKAYAGLEWFSLTGSIKDRVAYQMLRDAYILGKLHKGDRIVEVSSGNMGLSLVAVGNIMGNPVTIIMPKFMSEERKKLLNLYGGELVEVDNFTSAFKLCEEYKRLGYFCPEQFNSPSNSISHESITAHHIYRKTRKKHIDTFVCGIGTSGTFSGVGKILKEKLNIKVIAIEPLNARIVSNVRPFRKHALQGLSDEKLPGLFDKNICDDIIQISDKDAIAMTQKLCRELSLGVGISSGANFLGCVLSMSNSITVFPDDNKKYLSTSLSTPITTQLVENIELLSFKVI